MLVEKVLIHPGGVGAYAAFGSPRWDKALAEESEPGWTFVGGGNLASPLGIIELYSPNQSESVSLEQYVLQSTRIQKGPEP